MPPEGEIARAKGREPVRPTSGEVVSSVEVKTRRGVSLTSREEKHENERYSIVTGDIVNWSAKRGGAGGEGGGREGGADRT